MGSIGYWPIFTQTTQSIGSAALMSKKHQIETDKKGKEIDTFQKGQDLLLFEIFLNNQCCVTTNVDISRGDFQNYSGVQRSDVDANVCFPSH